MYSKTYIGEDLKEEVTIKPKFTGLKELEETLERISTLIAEINVLMKKVNNAEISITLSSQHE